MVARGEVWWHEHPEAGRRPHLVVTRSEACEVLHQVLAVPATRNRRGIPTEVAVDESDGMPQASVFSVDNTGLVRTSLLTERITVLSPAVMAEVCSAFGAAMDCGPFVGRRADLR